MILLGLSRDNIAYAILASALLALAVAAADQENVDPLIDIIANVRNSAQGARAAYIDGSAKETRKLSRGPWRSNAEKIESLPLRGIRSDRRCIQSLEARTKCS